jgi:hypothetical protein
MHVLFNKKSQPYSISEIPTGVVFGTENGSKLYIKPTNTSYIKEFASDIFSDPAFDLINNRVTYLQHSSLWYLFEHTLEIK